MIDRPRDSVHPVERTPELHNGAAATLMSGSGSTTFAIFKNQSSAEVVMEKFKAGFGDAGWMTVVPVA
jgi:4-diphosphocytidyl-2C-methyl-D-erythritol kinase